ncbi:hypothetical protein ACFYYH_23265 [Streptomyces sp. NPDC002018]|uniref:hypothetical protein n=1 Tax=Streptomyces sp. NPDC002018 TaxID=3364629 RepID=UPI0036A7F8B1
MTGSRTSGADGTGGETAVDPSAAEDIDYADCVLCGKPTEYPESVRGATLCPVCEWHEAQRVACSG